MSKKKISLTRGAILLRAWRKAKKITITRAARLAMISRGCWDDWEAGLLSPSVRNAALLEDHTGIPMRAWATLDVVPDEDA